MAARSRAALADDRNACFTACGEDCKKTPGEESGSGKWGLPPIKSIVLLLALRAAVKLAHQQYLFRSGSRGALLGAYRGHASEACPRQARSQAPALSVQAWANPAGSEPLIGKTGLDVSVASRQRPVEPALPQALSRLTAGPPAGTICCAYDILNAAASVHRM